MSFPKGKILFIYPNSEGYGGIPNGLALLSGCLKQAGFETRCFDTTFLSSQPKTLFYRQKHGGMMQADHSSYWGEWTPELAEQVPDLLCMLQLRNKATKSSPEAFQNSGGCWWYIPYTVS